MTPAVKRLLRHAEKNLGGLWVVPYGSGLRRINTVCAMISQGLLERHEHAGPILTTKGIAARERLLKLESQSFKDA